MFVSWQVFWLAPLLSAFPSLKQSDSGIWMVTKGFDGAYSSGNCSGFTPDSLFAPLTRRPKLGANIGLFILKAHDRHSFLCLLHNSIYLNKSIGKTK